MCASAMARRSSIFSPRRARKSRLGSVRGTGAAKKSFLPAEARQEIAVGFSARDRRSQEELPSESRLHVTAIINENRFQFLANDAPFQVLELQHKVEDHTRGARIIGYEASQMPPKVRRLGDAAKVNHPLQERVAKRQELRLFSPCPVGDRNGPFKGHARVYVGEFFVLQHGGHH